jgi:hypothetical protein
MMGLQGDSLLRLVAGQLVVGLIEHRSPPDGRGGGVALVI